MTEDYLDKLRKYVNGLEQMASFERKALDMWTPKDDPRTLEGEAFWNSVREPIIRTLVAYEHAIGSLYVLFPELKPQEEKIPNNSRTQ